MTLHRMSSSRNALAAASLGLLCLAGVLLPAVVAYLNRAAVIVWGLAVLSAVLRMPRARPLPDRAMAAFVIWSLATALWEYSPGLAVPQALQLAGLVIGGEWLLRSVDAYEPWELSRLRFAVVGGLALGLGLMATDWMSDCAILVPIQTIRGKFGINGCWMPYLKTAPTVLAVMTPFLWAWRRSVAVVVGVGLIALAKATGSHATLLALAMSATVYGLAVAIGRHHVAKAVGAILAALLLASPLLVHLLPQSKELAERAPWLPNSARHRVVIWQFADQLIAERPLLGWGLNNARAAPGGNDWEDVWSTDAAGTIFPLPQPRMPLHPHNMALQIWLETGLVGALLAAWAVWRLVLRIDRAAGAPGLAATAAAFGVGMVSFGAWQAWWLACLWLFAAFSLVLLRPVPLGRTE